MTRKNKTRYEIIRKAIENLECINSIDTAPLKKFKDMLREIDPAKFREDRINSILDI